MKLHPGSLLRSFTDNFPHAGRLEWIGVRPQRREPVIEVAEIEARTDRGLTGDYSSGKPGRRRQVTLIQHEHLPVIGALVANAVTPAQLRRNLVISGINVLALKSEVFRIGEVLLEGTGTCEPCSKMEPALGNGGYNALRGHGGITARVLVGGILRIGDEVRVVSE